MPKPVDEFLEQRKSLDLPVYEATINNFQLYGQLIIPQNDGEPFSASDPQVDFSNGIPRVYIMRITRQYNQHINTINRHRKVTQCLISADDKKAWYLVAAAPSHIHSDLSEPDVLTFKAFRIPGNIGVKLHHGTWHSGPFTDEKSQSFINIELSDTNINDRDVCVLSNSFGIYIKMII